MNQLVKASSLDGEIIAASDCVRLVARVHPLRQARLDEWLPSGLTIDQLLDLGFADQDVARPPDGQVCIDGLPIAIERWARVRPKPGTTVTFTPELGDLKTVLTLALVVAALIIAPWAAGPALLGLTGTALTVGTALIGAGIMLGGTLALNAMFPIRPPQLAAPEGFTSLSSIAGAQNRATPYESIPVVLGTHRFSPPYAAKPYTELVGDDQFLILLFCWGYGPLSIDQMKIGETPLSSYEYQIETREGFVSDSAISLYPSAVDEQALSVELTSPGGSDSGGIGAALDDASITWFTRTSAVDTTVLSLDITAPEGIFRIDGGSGSPVFYSVAVKVQYRAVGAVDWINWATVGFGRAVKTARQGIRLVIAAGQYQVRVGKAQRSYDEPEVKERVIWTALRSFTTDPPVRFPKPVALTALRIKATGQLNGVIDTFNGVVSSKVKTYSGSGDVWAANTVSQNPADLFRHVLQSAANARPVSDALIDLDNLQDFWAFCVEKGFTFNQVRGRASGYDTLADIAAAAFARPSTVDGRWGVIWDRPNDSIVQHFTPRNSWGFSGSRAYAQLPHGWRVKFINGDNGYTQDERIVYDDGYSVANATLFEAIEFPGVVDPDQIWKLGRRQIAQARLRPETISINAGWEQLVATGGDRVAVTHDVLLIGQVSGRVKSIAGQVITLDETVLIEAGKTYGFRFRLADPDNASIVRALDTVQGGSPGVMAPGEYAAGSSITLVGDLSVLAIGVLFGFGETDQESAIYRVKSIRHQKDLIAQLELVDDAPEISTADSGDIPDYDPHVSLPVDPLTLPPRDFHYIEIMEGYGPSVRGVVRLSWQVPRIGQITSFEVAQRDDTAAGDFVTVAVVPAPNTAVDLDLVAAGVWSYRVRCLFANGTASAWTSLNGLTLQGLTGAPGNVTNLHQYAVDGKTVLDWSAVDDQRTLRYEIRKGTSWDAGLVVGDAISQAPWPTTGDGTYHLRAFVLSPYGTRIYSEASASLSIADSIFIRNIIIEKDEQALGWLGGLDGGVISGSFIRTDSGIAITLPWAQEIIDQLALEGLHIAVYVSPTIVDIGVAAECRFWTEYEAAGVQQGEDFLAGTIAMPGTSDILGAASTRFVRAFPIWHFASLGGKDVFDPADIYAPADIFGAGITWEDWVAIASGTRKSRFWNPGFVLITDKEDVDATGTKFRWFVDVPDRTDDYTGLSVPDTGLDLTFYKGGFNVTPTPGVDALPFNGGPNGSTTPHVQRSIINQTNGDEVKVTNLTLLGCTVHVVNAGSNVARSGVELLVRGY